MPKSEMITQQDIQNMLDVWRMGCQNDTNEEYENCKKCPSKKVCKQAYDQLVLIVKQHFQQQPVKVTRERFEALCDDMRCADILIPESTYGDVARFVLTFLDIQVED